ncbi:hypothetical protein BK809_0007628 [Diplodia seriata]|uniref:Uncharacterized protein n=1 Tax=Diplodia seriata TaxID=420778 RepID=A0A1S8BJ75_9PEZI|nr:hypothetical protein BK809_0007628 [Diplodia seriata]
MLVLLLTRPASSFTHPTLSFHPTPTHPTPAPPPHRLLPHPPLRPPQRPQLVRTHDVPTHPRPRFAGTVVAVGDTTTTTTTTTTTAADSLPLAVGDLVFGTSGATLGFTASRRTRGLRARAGRRRCPRAGRCERRGAGVVAGAAGEGVSGSAGGGQTGEGEGVLDTVADPGLEEVVEATGGKEVDVDVNAVRRLRRGGRAVLLAAAEGEVVGVGMREFYRMGKSLVGCNSLNETVEAMGARLRGLVESGAFEGLKEVTLKELGWERVGLEDAVDAYGKAVAEKRKFVIVM